MKHENLKRAFEIMFYLYLHTDENNLAGTDLLISVLAEKNISAHRQTVASDIALLRDAGFDIITVRSRENKYYYGERIIDPAEIKIIGDAILASGSISKRQSEKLLNKLLMLVSIPQAEELRLQLEDGMQVKGHNEQVPYTVDILHRAIANRKRIKFQYYELSQNKKKILKHKGYFMRLVPTILFGKMIVIMSSDIRRNMKR